MTFIPQPKRLSPYSSKEAEHLGFFSLFVHGDKGYGSNVTPVIVGFIWDLALDVKGFALPPVRANERSRALYQDFSKLGPDVRFVIPE